MRRAPLGAQNFLQRRFQIRKLEGIVCLQQSLGGRALACEQQRIGHFTPSEPQHEFRSREDCWAMQNAAQDAGKIRILHWRWGHHIHGLLWKHHGSAIW